MSVFYGRALTATAWGGNWRIKFLSSGVFTPLKNMTVDTFLVGGGGGSKGGSSNNSTTAGAGG